MPDQEQKSRRGRFSYAGDYRKNEKGVYEYTGAYFLWKVSKEQEKKLRLRLRLASSAGVLLGVLAGVLPAAGMKNSFYVILPYAVSLIGTVMMAFAAWTLAAAENPMKQRAYEHSVQKIPLRSGFTQAAAALSVVGEAAACILRPGEAKVIWGICFLVSEIAIFLLSGFLRQQMREENWVKST